MTSKRDSVSEKAETFPLDFSCKGSMCGGDGQTG
jgi:hypothetical protein